MEKIGDKNSLDSTKSPLHQLPSVKYIWQHFPLDKTYFFCNFKVAIKIQYPGVRKSIESDISNLGLLLKIPGVFPKGMYMDRILKNTQIELTQ
jgi:predicted unusual protein kinase regulating ubiquinone biosynthesis (AarF/ABC1/UbiB family)